MAKTGISKTFYAYCTPYRPAGPGCQPTDGLIATRDIDPNEPIIPGTDITAWSVLLYDRKLSVDEMRAYELLPLCYDLTQKKLNEYIAMSEDKKETQP